MDFSIGKWIKGHTLEIKGRRRGGGAAFYGALRITTREKQKTLQKTDNSFLGGGWVVFARLGRFREMGGVRTFKVACAVWLTPDRE